MTTRTKKRRTLRDIILQIKHDWPQGRPYLAEDDIKIGGVCAGLAEYFNIDSMLVRFGFIVFGIVSFVMPALIVYLILWAIMPHRPEEQ